MAAAVNPVPVHVPNPQSADAPIQIPATEQLVQVTAFLRWGNVPAGGGQAARRSMPQAKAIKAFARRFKVGPDPADIQAASDRTPLRMTFTAAAWGRLLTELVASGLLDADFDSLSTFLDAIDALTIANPVNTLVELLG